MPNVIKAGKTFTFEIDFFFLETMQLSFQTLPAKCVTWTMKQPSVASYLSGEMFREENHGNVSGILTLKNLEGRKKKKKRKRKRERKSGARP